MKLYIPALRDKLRLTKDWRFTVKKDWRNASLTEYLHGRHPWWEGQDDLGIDDVEVIPEGTILSVDRIYIRQGAKDYDSITFRILKIGDKEGCRFWVPLSEANKIEFEPVEK